jgi:hypothetical protein
MDLPDLPKYPRTAHLEGSRLQPGETDPDAIPFASIRGRPVVVEEKLDGSHAGFAFDGAGDLQLLAGDAPLGEVGTAREKPFALFRDWARAHAPVLLERFEDRYVVFGEWLLAKHTVYYDRLPHYFLEFDIWDRRDGIFLSTPRRRSLCQGLPIVQVPVLATGRFERIEDLTGLVAPSLYKSADWRASLAEAAERAGIDPDRAFRETDSSDRAEGLYLKVEDEDKVVARLKWVRPGFLRTILGSGSHWRDRPILRNGLAAGVDIFAPTLPEVPR